MGISAFRRKQILMLEGIEYTMIREVEPGLWQLEGRATGRIREIQTQELLRLYAEGKIVFERAMRAALDPQKNFIQSVRHTEHIPDLKDDEETRAAKLKRAYVLAIWDHLVNPALLTSVIREVWEKHKKPAKPPHWTTVVRWRNRYVEHGKDVAALRPRRCTQGNRKRRVDQRTLDISTDAVDAIYMTRERNSIKDTLDRAIAIIAKKNRTELEADRIPLPTRRLITRLIKAIPAFDRWAARYGAEAARKKFRTVLKNVISSRPLEQAEMDHMHIDIFIVDEETGLPLGRPWITAIIDDFTRCILGIHIGFEPPSHFTVAQCLKHALLPKTNLASDYPEVKGQWQAFGTMDTLVVDNGLEFHAAALENACQPYGITIKFCPRKTPWYKGKIERFFRTLNDGVAHGFPGTTFSDIFEKDDYDAMANAVVTLTTFRTMVYKWIVDYYHAKPHRSLDATPDSMWCANITLEDINVPDDPMLLDTVLGRAEECTLTHKGIVIDHIYYNSPDLGDLRRQEGDVLKVTASVNDGDLGHVIVITPDGKTLIKTPAIPFEYANGLTRWQHNLCKKYARAKLPGKDSLVALAEAKEALRELVARDMKIRRRFHKKPHRTADPEAHGAVSPDPTAAAGKTRRPAAKDAATMDQPKLAAEPLSDLGVMPAEFEAVIRSRG